MLRQIINPNHSPNSSEVLSTRLGSILSHKAVDSLSTLAITLRAVDTWFEENHRRIMLNWDTFRFSPPRPNIARPRRDTQYSWRPTPREKIAWPRQIRKANRRLLERAPILSIK